MTENSDAKFDAVILAGGRAAPEMAHKTGTDIRALFPYKDKPFIQWVYEAVRASSLIDRIAVVGPEELKDIPSVQDADILMPELDSIDANLFGALARLLPENRVLITASDNPLLTTEAIDNFLTRCPEQAAVCYPILRHETFLRQFHKATNTGIKLKDGNWIGGGQVVVHSKSIPKLQHWMQEVLSARKDLKKMVALLGWKFALQFSLKRVSSQDVQDRVCEITGLPIRFIRDCSSVFPIDIDDPVDWDYLNRWSAPRSTAP